MPPPQRPPVALHAPQPIAVEAFPTPIGEAPRRVCWRGRWRRVTARLDDYIVDDDWFRAGEEVSRHYHVLLLDDAHRVTVFHDRLRGGWWLQRG